MLFSILKYSFLSVSKVSHKSYRLDIKYDIVSFMRYIYEGCPLSMWTVLVTLVSLYILKPNFCDIKLNYSLSCGSKLI